MGRSWSHGLAGPGHLHQALQAIVGLVGETAPPAVWKIQGLRLTGCSTLPVSPPLFPTLGAPDPGWAGVFVDAQMFIPPPEKPLIELVASHFNATPLGSPFLP